MRACAAYKKTDYYNVTHKSYASVLFNKGNYGEFLTYKYLQEYEAEGAKFLFNCYLPKNNGETTEIDVLMIHSSGIYVFESKNYSGWIFGSENQKNWTQTLPSGRKAHKEYFLNPIIQNKLHMKWLTEQVGECIPIHSMIVFSERCELKKIEVSSTNTYVIKRDTLNRTVRAIDTRMGKPLSQKQIDEIYIKLYPYTQVSETIKERHIQKIQVQKAEYALRCPKCGGKLVLKEAKKGIYAGNHFYGCSNFPKCRYLQNI
jgi:DNA-directed RNA polymerase subunit RPC12/RpoP